MFSLITMSRCAVTWTILLAWCIVASTANSADPCEEFHKSYRQLEGSSFAFSETYPSKRSDAYCQIKHRKDTAAEWDNVCSRNLLNQAFHMERRCNESCSPTFDHRMTYVTARTHTGELRLLFNARTVGCFNLTVYRKEDLVITVSIPEMDSIRINPDTWGHGPKSLVWNKSLTVKLLLAPAAPESADVYLEPTGRGNDRPEPVECVGGWTRRVCAVSIPASTNHNTSILSVDLGVSGVPEEYQRIRVLAVGRATKEDVTSPEGAVNVPLVVGLPISAVVVAAVIALIVYKRCKLRPEHWLYEFRSEIELSKEGKHGTITLSLLERITNKYTITTNAMRHPTGSDEVEQQQPLQQSTLQEYKDAVAEVLSGRINQIPVSASNVTETDGLADNISQLEDEVNRYREAIIDEECASIFDQFDNVLNMLKKRKYLYELFKKIPEVEECISDNISVQWDLRNGEEHLKILQGFREELEDIKQQLDSVDGNIAGETERKYERCQKHINNRREEITVELKKRKLSELLKKISEVEECISVNISVQWDFRNGEENLRRLQGFREELEYIKQQFDSVGGNIAGETNGKYEGCQEHINNRQEEISVELKKFDSFKSVIEDCELKDVFVNMVKDKLPIKQDLDDLLENAKERYYKMSGEDLVEEWKTICSLALAYQSISKVSVHDVCYHVDFRLLRVFGDKNRVGAVQPLDPPIDLRDICCRMMSHLLHSKKEDDVSGVLSFVVRFWTELDLQEPQNIEFPNWEAAKAFSGRDYLTSEKSLRGVLGEQLRAQPGDPGRTITWISRSMLGLWTEDPMFVRALTKAVLDSITDSNQENVTYDCGKLGDNCPQLLCRFALRKSICCGVNLKVEMLLADQEWIEKENVLKKEDSVKDILICLKKKHVIGDLDILAWMTDLRNKTPQQYVTIVGDIFDKHREKKTLEELRPGDVDDDMGELQSIETAFRQRFRPDAVGQKLASNTHTLMRWMQQDECLQANKRKKGFVKMIVGLTCYQVFRHDATVDGICAILADYVHTAEQRSEALDGLNDIIMAHSMHAEKIKELFSKLFDREILTTKSVVRWHNQGGVMSDPTSMEFIYQRLESESKTLLNEIEKNDDLAKVIDKIHQVVPTRQLLDFGKKAIMRMVRGSYERNQGPGEKFDLLQFHERVPLLWYITGHEPHIDRAIIEAMKSGRVAGTADLCGSPWYVPLIKTLLFGNALSMAAVRECHVEIGYSRTRYDNHVTSFLQKLWFHN